MESLATKTTCAWCGAPGEQIGTSYGPLTVWKCTKCHHEWETITPNEEEDEESN